MSSSEQLVLKGCVSPTNPVISTSKAIWLWCGSKSPDTQVTIRVTAKAYNCFAACPIHISYQIDGQDVFTFDVPCDQTITQYYTIPCKFANGNKHALNAWSNWGCISCTDAIAYIEAPPPPSPTPAPPTPPAPSAPGLPTEYMLLFFMMLAVLIVVLAIKR